MIKGSGLRNSVQTNITFGGLGFGASCVNSKLLNSLSVKESLMICPQTFKHDKYASHLHMLAINI